MHLSLKRDPLPATLSCLQYGNTGSSCQQVCLVSDPHGDKIFTGVVFLSLFSKYLSSLLKNDQAQMDEVPTIILPVPVHILKLLLGLLSTGGAVCSDVEDAFSLGKAAEILGISTNEDWKIETKFKGDATLKEGQLRIDNMLSLGIKAKQDYLPAEETSKYSQKRFKCDICGQSFTSRGTLIAHNIFKHSQSTPIICQECPICKKTVKHVRKVHDLGFHINQHLQEERRYRCDKCPVTFYKSQHLKRHKEAKHSSLKSVECHATE